ncbi:hypothetical protein ABZ682_13680 [Streptomyces griseoviridis]|uniref:hypothetical protein n=1 Tax=Streptomyces griseoviridis TaxID=45398 RepID=UPI0033EB2B55
MVSSPHEAMHRIFQDHPGLFSGVSEALGVRFTRPTAVSIMPTDLTETSPLERRVDTLLRLETEDEEPFLLAIEAQGKKDPDKLASWAYYASYLLTKYRLQPMLLVVCQDRATAEWASRPVRFGPPQWPLLTLRPLVAGPHNMPVITDPAEVRKDLALATLSAITHVTNPDVGTILKAMTTVLRETPHTLSDPIVELIAQGMGKHPAAEIWRKLMAVDLSFYKSPIFQEIRDETLVKTRAQDILVLLEARGLDIPDDARERITTCDDPDLLRRWITRTLTAVTVNDLFTDE